MTNTILRIYRWSLRHWFINYLVYAIPIAAFTIYQIAPKQLRLTDDNGKLYLFSSILFWFFVGVSIVYPCIVTWGEKLHSGKMKDGDTLLKHVLESVNTVCSRKLNRFNDYIKHNSKRTTGNPFVDITKPKIQIEYLCNELQICLSKILDMERTDIGISIIYKTQNRRNWDWLYKSNLRNGSSINDIVKNDNSSAKQIINETTDFIFIRDKKQGVQNSQYMYGRGEQTRDNEGSIICRDIGVAIDNNKYVQAILSITTYGKSICKETDEQEVKKVLDYILKPFDTRFKLELSLFFIKEQHEDNIAQNA